MSHVMPPSQTGQATMASIIKEGSIESFQADVLDASRTGPVIVDFWAPWCGPCKALGPALERAITAQAGKVHLVKIDIDKNQMLAQQLRIQSVPTVMTFIAGQPVDGFQGALPEGEINAFLDRALQMAAQAGIGGGEDGTDPASVLKTAFEALGAGDLASAAQLFGELAQEVEKGSEFEARALAGLAQCHLGTGNDAEAAQLIDMIAPPHLHLPDVARAKAALDLAQDTSAGAGGEGIEALIAQAASTPGDLAVKYELANAFAAAGQMEEASETLLFIIAQEQDWKDGAARQKLLTIFEALGPTDPVTIKARRALSSLLFS